MTYYNVTMSEDGPVLVQSIAKGKPKGRHQVVEYVPQSARPVRLPDGRLVWALVRNTLSYSAYLMVRAAEPPIIILRLLNENECQQMLDQLQRMYG
jgi:hypothetical protein